MVDKEKVDFYEKHEVHIKKPLKEIDQPSHYHRNKIDVHGYLKDHFPTHASVTVSQGFHIGNVIKYTSRYMDKNGLEDLIKARNNLDVLIQMEVERMKRDEG